MEQQEKNKKNRPFTHQDFASLLTKYQYKLNLGDITAGTVFSKEKRGFLVDIGEAAAAYLPINEISIEENKIIEPVINNSREFFILAYNKISRQLIISIKRLEYIRGWQRVKQLKKEDITSTVYIEKINKGGLITRIEGLKGFIPNSQITDIKSKSSLKYKKLRCQFFFINDKKNTIILSNKRARLEELISKIYIGQVIEGTIIQIQKYGVFVNIYGFTALLHISELGTDNLNDIKTFYIGNIIKVKVLHIDTKQGRITVSRRYKT